MERTLAIVKPDGVAQGCIGRGVSRKEGALQRLSAKPGKKQSQVDPEAYEALKRELQEKERAMADQAVELAILRKKTSGGSWDR